MIDTPVEHDPSLQLAEYAEKAYLAYAMSVIKGRAIPSISDGQKPVQRRILFAMRALGLTVPSSPVKSSRVVGDVIGKYHPHGDASAYEAMVRMAQDFTLRYPLVDGVGNYGSRDGDPAAAMRYTEARLTPFSELLLAELELGTVDFMPNYDGKNQEPVELPARLPVILLNGATGIAVGLATEIPSHNLQEVADATVALLKQPQLSTQDLMRYIQGPDFATGAQIINTKEELVRLYESGKGSVRVRAKYRIEKLARSQWRIVVYEIPHLTSAQKILTQIEDQTNPKARLGKKTLSKDQYNTRSLLLSVLDRVRDESDYEQPTRLVFEPKSSRQDPEEFMNVLMAQTDLEVNIPVHLIMIGLDGRPQQKSLKQILEEWISFRRLAVTRRLKQRLDYVNRRMHILSGRLTVFLHLDAVITLIRESEHPKEELIARFKLSETQTEDILELRLRQLAKLEWLKLEKELNQLGDEAKELEHLITNEGAKNALIIKEIQSDKKKFGDSRRTEIRPAERSTLTHTIPDEAITIILSRKGWIRSRAGHQLDIGALTFKEGDSLQQSLETRTISTIQLLDQRGRSYTIDPANIPNGRGDGIPISTLIDMEIQCPVVGMLSGTASHRVLLASSSGYAFITSIEHMVTKLKAGKSLISISENDQALAPLLVPSDKPIESLVLIAVSDEPRLLAFPLQQIRTMSRGRGLKIMELPHQYRLHHLLITHHTNYQLHLQLKQRNWVETYPVSDLLSQRGKKGKPYKFSGTIMGISSA